MQHCYTRCPELACDRHKRARHGSGSKCHPDCTALWSGLGTGSTAHDDGACVSHPLPDHGLLAAFCLLYPAKKHAAAAASATAAAAAAAAADTVVVDVSDCASS